MKKVPKKYQLMTLDELDEAWQVLTEREKTVLTKRFGLENGSKPQIRKVIGKNLGVSEQRIVQIENIALRKLRSAGHQLEEFGKILPFVHGTNLPSLPKAKTLVVKRKKKPKQLPLPVTLPPQPPVPKCSEKKRLNWLERWITGSGTAIRRGIDGITLLNATGGVEIYAENLRELIDRAIHKKKLP